MNQIRSTFESLKYFPTHFTNSCVLWAAFLQTFLVTTRHEIPSRVMRITERLFQINASPLHPYFDSYCDSRNSLKLNSVFILFKSNSYLSWTLLFFGFATFSRFICLLGGGEICRNLFITRTRDNLRLRDTEYPHFKCPETKFICLKELNVRIYMRMATRGRSSEPFHALQTSLVLSSSPSGSWIAFTWSPQLLTNFVTDVSFFFLPRSDASRKNTRTSSSTSLGNLLPVVVNVVVVVYHIVFCQVTSPSECQHTHVSSRFTFLFHLSAFRASFSPSNMRITSEHTQLSRPPLFYRPPPNSFQFFPPHISCACESGFFYGGLPSCSFIAGFFFDLFSIKLFCKASPSSTPSTSSSSTSSSSTLSSSSSSTSSTSSSSTSSTSSSSTSSLFVRVLFFSTKIFSSSSSRFARPRQRSGD